MTHEQIALLLILLVILLPNGEQGAIAFDQWLNTRLGGMADETLSARAYPPSPCFNAVARGTRIH